MGKTPIKWYGGKQLLVNFLLRLLPPHRCYVEPCGGSGALLFAKDPSTVEVYNDLNGDVVNFFRVLREPCNAEHLIRALENTPYARDEHADCLANYNATTDPIERARKFFVLIRQSFNGVFKETWSYSTAKNCGSDFSRGVATLYAARDRLRNVQIENRDCVEVCRQFDSPETLVYIDPPYVTSSRNRKNRYKEEMTDDDHRRLVAGLNELEAAVLLSGYANPIYEEGLSGWERLDVPVACHSTGLTSGRKVTSKATRVESVWLNAAAVKKSPHYRSILNFD